MTAYRSFTTHDLHSSECGGARAGWKREGAELRVMFVDDPSSDRSAFRWPDEPMPAVRAGHIAFGETAYPDLATARERLPEYARLWDTVREDFLGLIQPDRGPDSAAALHREFFSLPY